MNLTQATSDQNLHIKMYKTLVGIASICGLIIVFVYQFTAPIIQTNKELALQNAINAIFPEGERKQIYYQNETGGFSTEKSTTNNLIYASYNAKEKLIGFAIPAQGMGYQDNISLIYAYDPNTEHIIGLKILQSRETPGLGSRIEEDPTFLQNFHKLNVKLNSSQTALLNKIASVKPGKKSQTWEVDSISGATVSSVAVTQIIQNSATFWLPQIKQNLEDFSRGQ